MDLPGRLNPRTYHLSRLLSRRVNPVARGGTGLAACRTWSPAKGVLMELPGSFSHALLAKLCALLPNSIRAGLGWPAMCRLHHHSRSERRF